MGISNRRDKPKSKRIYITTEKPVRDKRQKKQTVKRPAFTLRRSNKLAKSAPDRVEKKWGHELWIHNSKDYCGKILTFYKKGKGTSMHYHVKKLETWYVASGSFDIHWIDPQTAKKVLQVLMTGDVMDVHRGIAHKIVPRENNSVLFEVSTEHFDEDSYRIYRDDPNELNHIRTHKEL